MRCAHSPPSLPLQRLFQYMVHSCWSHCMEDCRLGLYSYFFASLKMAPPRAYGSLCPNSVLDVDLWKRFYEDEDITADVPPPAKNPPAMSTTKPISLSPSETEQAVRRLTLGLSIHTDSFRSLTYWTNPLKPFCMTYSSTYIRRRK